MDKEEQLAEIQKHFLKLDKYEREKYLKMNKIKGSKEVGTLCE